METQQAPAEGDTRNSIPLSPADYGFFALMAIVVVLVVWVGVMSFEEGMKTEGSKRNGEAWVAWLTQASAKRFDPEFELAECAASAQATEAPTTSAPAAAAEGTNTEDADQATPKPETPAAAAPAPNSWGACAAKIMELPEFKKW